VTAEQINLRVAGLRLLLDARGGGVPLPLPACHRWFAESGAGGAGLVLRVRDGPLASTDGMQPVFCDPGTWQLWRDIAGRHVFFAPRSSPPPRQITIDAAFTAGEVTGEFSTMRTGGWSGYPLQDIDMMIFANWLAETGDLIMHSSGVDDSGEGYAFVGPSGAGKSTLAAELSAVPGVTVLGEDTVIVRRQAGRFMLYGTPWHTDPRRCAPGGVPLTKLFFLDRSAGHHVLPCKPRDGIERLLQQGAIPYYNRAGVERILENLSSLAEQIPCYVLGFEIGADVIELIREA